MKVDWQTIKNSVDNKNLNLQYIEKSSFYILYTFDGSFVLQTELYKNPTDTTDLNDFVNNYKINANTQIITTDNNGVAYRKNMISDPDLIFKPRAFDWYVCQHNSLYNRSFAGTGSAPATVAGAIDMTDASMKFYQADGTEFVQGGSESDAAYQLRLDAGCTMTDVIFNPSNSRKCIGAKFNIHNKPTSPSYLWAYVDMTSIGYGYAEYTPGGIPLHMMAEDGGIVIDGRTVPENPIPSGCPVIFRVRHDVVSSANQFGIHVFLEQFSG